MLLKSLKPLNTVVVHIFVSRCKLNNKTLAISFKADITYMIYVSGFNGEHYHGHCVVESDSDWLRFQVLG